MSDAFLCDVCEEYYAGEPSQMFYRKESHDRQGIDYSKVLDLCEDCATELVSDDD
jgi:hypothetical protein